MTEYEIKKLIREEIRRTMNVVQFGQTESNTESTEGISNLFPNMPTIPTRPVMHPFGLVSRAVKGTIQVVSRIGEHIGNQMVLGHRDKDRPTDIEEGETILYSSGGYRIFIKNNQLMIGKGDESEVTIAGESLNEFLGELVTMIASHTHPSPGAPPTSAGQFTQMKTEVIDGGTLLNKDGGRF